MSGRTSELMAAGGLDFDEMELTLGLPGESRKRRFSDTLIDFKLGSLEKHEANESDGECSDNFDPTRPPSKERVIGWPPVRSQRKSTKNSSNCKYVKVAVDGAPYLRKVDLRSYTCYQQLLGVIQDIMFPGFTIHNHVLNESKIMDHVNRSEHVPTYEDKDGDWMLVGDVPWKMFVETCKRIRLMKSSEAINQLASSKNST